MKPRILLIAIFTLAAPLAHAQLFKCVQPDGSTAYQDSACPAGASSKALATPVSRAPSMVTMTPDAYGHFRTRLSINDVEVDGLIDTGATSLTLPVALARAMNISGRGGKFSGAGTANGNMLVYNTVVPVVRIGNIELYNVDVCITSNSPPLIGMSALSRFTIKQENGQMIMTKR